jgi:hypothetical protein
MKKILVLLLCVLAITIVSCVPIPAQAQNCVLKGKTFEQVDNKSTKEKDMGVKTQYTYKAKDGKEYPIYLSKTGKAFIWRVSAKTGKQYKQYLPEVTKQLQANMPKRV